MERTFQGLILGILIEWKMIRAQSEFSLLEPVAGKILKDMGIPDHLTSLLRNLYAGQEATVRTGHGKTYCFQIGKEVHQGCI